MNKRIRWSGRLAVVLAGLTLAAAWVGAGTTVQAQQTGRIEGKAVDEAGNPVTGIELKFVPADKPNSTPRKLKVGGDGTFRHSFFPYGRYLVSLSGDASFIKSMTYVLKDDAGVEIMAERADAHPEKGLPPFKVGLGQVVNLTLVISSQEHRKKLLQAVALSDASGPLKKAAEAYDAGNMPEVIEITGKILASKPEIGMAHYLRGLALTNLARYDEAEAALRKAAEIEPEREGTAGALGVALVKHAEALVKAGRTEEAKPLFSESLEHVEKELGRMPGTIQLLMTQAIALEELGRTADLIVVLEKVLVADPSNATIRFRLADLMAKGGNVDRAMEILGQAPRSEKRAGEFIYTLAAERFNEGEIDAAISAAKLGLEFDADLHHLHRLLGRAYASKGEDALAIAELEKAVALAPKGDAEAVADRDLATAIKKKKP